MKIYTYYEDISHSNQETMLQLWQISWSNAGFNPIILTKKDAENHSFYESFIQKLEYLYYEIMTERIDPYCLSCYTRWLAYSTQPKEKFYVSDYDCINNGLKVKEPSDQLHLMNGACPCFVSGSPSQFEKLCHNFIEISLDRIEEIKKLRNHTHIYHDQNFFRYNFTQKYNQKANNLITKNNMLMTRDSANDVSLYEINKVNTCKVLHISHQNADRIKKNDISFKEDSINDIRIKIMKHIIYNTK